MSHQLVKQPLIHFLLLGGLLFAAHHALLPEQAEDEQEIRFDREQLLSMLQFRAKTFDRAHFEQLLDQMSVQERQALEREWLREEVLYREARARQLDRHDYVIRKRLVDKLEYLTRGFIESGVVLKPEEVAAYFDAHRDDYIQPETVTFTHVFFSRAINGDEQARQLAQETLAGLIESKAGFQDSVAYGDRFAYHNYYVERSREYVAAQFDEAFATELFSNNDTDEGWQGPLESALGFHLVLVSGRQAQRQALLEDVYAQAEADAREARVRQKMDEVLDELMARHGIAVGGESQS